jgi:asparagine synthase (glutamine-hydrolysing)
MCRIAGYWDLGFKGGYEREAVLKAMRDALAYAGPDDAGSCLDDKEAVALGHRRLSIIELSSLGHQPMAGESGRVWITYNGEVYNFPEIRSELEQRGHKFISHSDTEVVLKSYEAWGIDCVQKFRGMWAFAIWDKNKEELILCRDRLGVKPLYWYWKDNLFIFASELKAMHQHPGFRKELDMQALSLYLQYGYINAPTAIFKNTYKLEPGHFLVLNKRAEIKKIKYWDAGDYCAPAAGKEDMLSDEDAARRLEEILSESFKLRLVSDVPVGMFLSGGIDSSLVTALLQKESRKPLKTFTIGFREQGYNEAAYAENIARHLGTEHTQLYCTPQEAREIIPRLAEIYDEPFGDSSAIPTHLVARLARQQVKVALSADAGDEQFCGYDRYWLVDSLQRKANMLPGKRALSAGLGCLPPGLRAGLFAAAGVALGKKNMDPAATAARLRALLKERSPLGQYDIATRYFMDDEIDGLGLQPAAPYYLPAQRQGLSGKQAMMLLDLRAYLPGDILAKVDRATMAVALEAREPFLDQRIVEFSCGLPLRFKYRDGVSKHILRKILYKYVPARLLERPKQGFALPVNEWFRDSLRELYLEQFAQNKIRREGLFRPEKISALLKQYLRYNNVNAGKLWLLFVFEMWRERWM